MRQDVPTRHPTLAPRRPPALPGGRMGTGLRTGAIAAILVSVWAFCGPPPALAQEAYADVRAKALAPTRQDFDRIVAAHPQDHGIAGLRERLAAVDRVVDLV